MAPLLGTDAIPGGIAVAPSRAFTDMGTTAAVDGWSVPNILLEIAGLWPGAGGQVAASYRRCRISTAPIGTLVTSAMIAALQAATSDRPPYPGRWPGLRDHGPLARRGRSDRRTIPALPHIDRSDVGIQVMGPMIRPVGAHFGEVFATQAVGLGLGITAPWAGVDGQVVA